MNSHKRIRSLIMALLFSLGSIAVVLTHVFDPVDLFLESQVYPNDTASLTELKDLYLVFINWTILFVLIYFMFRFTFEFSAILFSLEMLGTVAGALVLHAKGYRYPVSVLLIFSFGAFFILILYHYIVEKHTKKQVMGEIRKYISPDIADSVVNKEKDTLITQKREICVFYVDIRGFTKLSEDLEPEAIVDILNRYLEMVTTKIVAHGGMVDKYIGDAVMAIWNAPKDQEDYLFNAIMAAIDIRDEGKKLSDEIRHDYRRALKYGIGIHVGEAVVGSIGCENRMEYTAIGDTVNTAFRLQGNAKGGQILVSKAVKEALGDRIKTRYIGGQLFKNKKHETICYEVKEVLNHEKPADDSEAE